MSTTTVALYARVSSEQQAQTHTIDSQLAALRERIAQDRQHLLPEHEFIDRGYSGSTLLRPALERLRDAVAAGEIERLYVHSPDRLARKYAYQVMLVDECQRAGVTIVFLNRALDQSPEDELLLQVQGMIAEYERAKMLERSRRGKRHRAQQGEVNVLSGAPYGYRYVSVAEGGGQARYEIDPQQAQVIRRIFDWVGRERLSLNDVCRRLKSEAIASPRGKSWWDRTTVWGLLKNPAYRGQAAFGKTHADTLRHRLREQRGRTMTPRSGRSTYDVPASQWLTIPVPSLVSEALFDAVQVQLEENRQRARSGQRGVRYLLQGLLVCACCGYAYYGKAISPSARKHHTRNYAYYRCIGNDAYRFGGHRLCQNKQLRTDRLEQAVWGEVCRLLEDPRRVAGEYQRRLDAVQAPPGQADAAVLERQMAKVQQGIARLIDGYAEGYLDKTEAEPRIRRFKERLHTLEVQAEQARTQARLEANLQLVIGRLEEFSAQVSDGLEQLDWHGRRDLIRTLVKRVEIEPERVRVVFRVDEDSPPPGQGSVLQRCCRSAQAHSSKGVSTWKRNLIHKQLHAWQAALVPVGSSDAGQFHQVTCG
jgi:site-specific DNA recombinase